MNVTAPASPFPPPLLPDVLIQSAQSMYEINFACTRLPPLFGLGSSCQ